MSDRLFHRRRARAKQELQRKKAQRDSYDRVLIVCEGSKTEPKYFMEWRKKLRLNSANIEVVGDCGSDPVSVVRHGIERAQQEGDYDKVFCVFDRDRHTNFEEAKERIRGQDPDIFRPVISVPCFEVWIALHYELTTKSIDAMAALAMAKRAIKGYKKGMDGVVEHTFSRVEEATKRARLVRAQGERDGFDNPYTNVDELVTYMRRLKGS